MENLRRHAIDLFNAAFFGIFVGAVFSVVYYMTYPADAMQGLSPMAAFLYITAAASTVYASMVHNHDLMCGLFALLIAGAMLHQWMA